MCCRHGYNDFSREPQDSQPAVRSTFQNAQWLLISHKVLHGSSSQHPNGIYPSINMLIHFPRSTSTGVEYETWGCFHCEFGATGPRISVCVYIPRRYEGGRMRLLIGGITGIEVVVLGGHVIVGLSK